VAWKILWIAPQLQVLDILEETRVQMYIMDGKGINYGTNMTCVCQLY